MPDEDLFQTAADACSALASEFRIRILYTLYSSSEPMRYATIFDAVDESDSGRLNYHLNELTGLFVAKTDDGYRLTLQGKRIISSFLASRYFDSSVSDETPLERACPECGETLRLEQSGLQPEIRCPDCGLLFDRYGPFPLSAWENHDATDVPDALDTRLVGNVTQALDGVCHECYSPLSRELDAETDRFPYYPEREFEYMPIFDCETCTNYLPIPYIYIAWLHPAVQQFSRSHGVRPEETPLWSIDDVVDSVDVTLLDEEPLRVAVSFRFDDDRCRVHIDDSHEVEQVISKSTY